MRYLDGVFNIHKTPQGRPIPNRPEQVMNSAGGYVWNAGDWKRLERFLILGSEAGTYYVSERKLTLDNAQAVARALKNDGPRVVDLVVEISAAGRAARNDPALFALAMAASPAFAGPRTNSAALAALALVARTAGHLTAFAGFVDSLRGWGRGLRSAVADWYLQKPVPELAYQMLKYRNRNGWSHRDLLRLSHPKANSPEQNALFRWAIDSEIGALAPAELKQVTGFELAQKATTEAEVAGLIEEYGLTHEMIPSRWKKSPAVWEALLGAMPYTAMLRHLGKLTAVGLLDLQSPATALVVARLIDQRRVERARIHPVALLAALLIYRQGHGELGKLRWTPAPAIVDALDEAFYLAFDYLRPTGQRLYLALDASGSMQSTYTHGMPFLTAAMGSVAMAMAFARTEPACRILAFHDQIWHVDIGPRDRLDRAVSAIRREPRNTNAALPFEDALARGLEVDAFVIMTDHETWVGDQHPSQALAQYRRETGIPAKLVVVAMAANEYSIADPEDALQMDVAGFDASVPAVISGFLAPQAPGEPHDQ